MVAVGVVGVLYINDHEALATIQDESAQLQAHVTQAELLLDDSQHRIADLNEQLDLHKQLLSVARTEANAASASVDKLNSAVASVSQTATYLTKLKETDEELLAKYSKVYFLNEHYVPRALTNIPPVYTAGKTIQFHAQAEPFLQRLLDAATSAGLHVQVASAYRSFEYQGQLKGQYTQTYGSGANTFSADQGYSEHQLGTALDLSTQSLGGGLTGFDTTPEYAWLLQHAHEFGFTLSYPQGNSYYVFEPWHWRFVGVALATYLHDHNLHFYDVPQRDIDAYRANIFD
jgi:D-alanyl-D-alanine carboxypeptidase